MCKLEELDRIPVRILDLDLSTNGTGFHVVAKPKPDFLQFSDDLGRSETFKTPRFQPPASCGCPFSIGREPEAPGPLGRICASPSDTLAKAGAAGAEGSGGAEVGRG